MAMKAEPRSEGWHLVSVPDPCMQSEGLVPRLDDIRSKLLTPKSRQLKCFALDNDFFIIDQTSYTKGNISANSFVSQSHTAGQLESVPLECN